LSRGKLPSIQDEKPATPIPVDRVGFIGLKIPAGRMTVNGLEFFLIPEFQVFIDKSDQDLDILLHLSF